MDQDLFQIERINPNKINWKPGQKEKIVELYLNKTSINKIGKLFGGLHYNTIKKILIENEVTLRTRSQSHFQDDRNDRIFEDIDTEEKAYWLGFLAADGCVSGNYIIITLQEKAYHHIEKFRAFLKANSIQIRFFLKKDTKGKDKKYCEFSIGCKKMAEDLKKHGVVERKSLILKPPILKSRDFEYSWIRGFFDGDGGLSYSKKNNRWQSYANSTKEVLKWIVEILELNTKPFNQKHYGKPDNVYRIHFNGRINVYKAWNKMYLEDKATIYLDRKYKLYKELQCSFNK